MKAKRKSSDLEPQMKSKKSKVSTEKEGNILKDASVFGELTNKCGIVLKSGHNPNEILKDQAVFQRDLTVAIKRHQDYPQVTEEFIEALSKHIEDQTRFYWSLMPTTTNADTDASARSGHQDSLVRMLMGVDDLQPSIMNMLLEKLAELTGDEEPIVYQNERVNMARLIMNQFRWLDRIVKGKEVTQKMFEIVCIVDLDAQREIISCIPEVVDDAEHNLAANELKDLLVENNSLAVPILDALANLNLKTTLLSEVRGSVMQTLDSAKLEDLPIIVKFLLQTVSGQEALQVISELRSHLDFQSCFPPNDSSTPNIPRSKSRIRNKSDTNTMRGNEALTLDAIKSSIRFQKAVAEAWIKSIEAVGNAGDHKVVDMFVLLILHTNNHKKPVESLIRNKIRAGQFTEVLLQATFGGHAQVLREYFPSVLTLAEVLLRSPEPAISYFSSAMYKQAFLAFDTYCQQEIVGNLVTHIGSGFTGEIDSSLDILADLVETNTSKMAPFTVFVKGVLDYLDNLSVTQIRKLYSMLSTLAFCNPEEEGQIQDELHIIIRKQLSNNSPKYKLMGVIGAIMVVKSMAKASLPDHTVVNTEAPLSEDSLAQVVSLLKLVKASSERSPEALALYMDELTSIIRKGNVHSKVEAWVSDNVINDFQDDFIVDIEQDTPNTYGGLPMSKLYDLDEQEEGAIAINLLPMVVNQRTRRPSGAPQPPAASPLCLGPQFRLLQTCEGRQHNGDLEGIDALLGCPLYLPNPDIYDKMDSLSRDEKHALCETLFLALNWFREVINAFACQNDAEMKAKVITRLHNITILMAMLQKCLAVTPTFTPPPANFDWEENKSTYSTSVATSGTKRAKKTGKGKGKKKGEEKETLNETEDSRDSSQLNKETQLENEKDADSDKGTIDLRQYTPFFRELDLEVFTILETGLITKAALDTEMNVKDQKTLQLEPPQLQMLLEDLARKVDHSLLATTSKRRTFLKTKVQSGFAHIDQISSIQIAEKIVKMLPALCDHLEAASAFFQALIAANDGIIDGPGWATEEAQQLGSCFHLLLQILLTLFSWNGFLMAEHRSLLKEALLILGSRLSTSAATQATFSDLLKQIFHYVENFSGTVPNVSAAVTLIKILVVLAEKSDSEGLNLKIANLSQSFLKREWFGPDGQKEKGAKHNELLQQLLQLHLRHCEDELKAIEDIAAVGVTELVQADKNGSSETYPTLTRNSYPMFYRVMLNQLVDVSRKAKAMKSTDTTQVKLEKLVEWNLAVRVFHILVNLVKVFDGRGSLGCVLKYGRQFVDHFLRLGMPLLDSMFRTHREEVQSLLKNLQLSTRHLHHLCGHSKIIKDISLTNQVPPMKKCLEAFVYRVKAMLTLNKCLEAFWLGNLKNRDLQGEEILSQSTVVSTSRESESENEELPEDEDSDVEVDQESVVSAETNAGGESGSDDENYSETY